MTKKELLSAAVEHLAAYFTGTAVVHHSLGLGAGGNSRARATEYFELRKALGVEGYPSPEDAKRAIYKTLDIAQPAVCARCQGDHHVSDCPE